MGQLLRFSIKIIKEKRAQIAPIAPTLGGVFVYLVQCTYILKKHGVVKDEIVKL